MRISANPLELLQGKLPDWLLNMPLLAWLAYENQPNFTPSTADVGVAVTVAWADLTLQQQLGEGASGVIHQAVLDGESVAVKLFKGAVTSDGWPAAELAASLSAGLHPHLIPIT
ncbi:protein kinase, partial [Roseateles sp. GG27B]